LAPGAVTPLQAAAELRDDEVLDARDRETWARRGLWIWSGVIGVIAVVALVWWALRRRRHRRHRH
jgi:uncharacterized protein (TIGR03382 family)